MNGKYHAQELEIFEATVEKPKNMKLLFNSLKTIPPTSIESQHAFLMQDSLLQKSEHD